ncbi:putative BTB/POZ domain-containing protein [Acanthamoeba polyphaga mimivirus]|uniref:Putative BTB/POZ domain-containing protein n=1 Tax=Acanthamoeba polyphaga mimivirus TaxID=212035 RepID=A0A0G2XZS2_MIMIV|nr:putative BTB/POZ domain-containing protein [Acanthamoeba polyphaga mimivirus]
MLDNLYKFSLEGKMTDIILEIEDDDSVITMNLHKNILAASCSYFDRLFNGNFFDSNTQKVKINVSNSLITKNIIKSFYDQENDVIDVPDWQYVLEEIICKDYLGLDYDTSALKDINVPSEYYDLLIYVAGIVGFNNPNITNLLTDLMPIDYDLTNISKDDIEFLLNRTGDCIFSLHYRENWGYGAYHKYYLKILDSMTGNVIGVIDKYITKKFTYNYINHEIIYIDFDKVKNTSLIKCLKLSTNLEYHIKRSHNVENIILSNDGKILISYHIDKSEIKSNSRRRSKEIAKSCLFKFFDVSDKKILFSFYVKNIIEKNTHIFFNNYSEDDSPYCDELSKFYFETKFMDISPDDKYLVCCFSTGFCLCLNIETKEVLWTTNLCNVNNDNYYFKNSILSNSLYIVSLKDMIYVLDVSNGNTLKKIKKYNEGVYNFDENIMMIYHSNKIEIYDWKNDKTIRTIKSTEKMFKHVYDSSTMSLYSYNKYDNIVSYKFNNFDIDTFTNGIISEDCDKFVFVRNYNKKIQDKLSDFLKTLNKTSEYDCVGSHINEID